MGRVLVGVIDVSARETHFLEHLAPVWKALPADLKGIIYVETEETARAATALGVGPVELGWPTRDLRAIRRLGPILVASWSDLRVCKRSRRPLVLFEHGAGQSYGGRHTSYAGGKYREKVSLFIVPNEQAAEKNRRFYPSIPNVVVGSPRVDELRRLPAPAGAPTVAISFHWRCAVVPETGSAIDAYARSLTDTRERLAGQGVEMIGHAHPRIMDEARLLYRRAGIEAVDSFADVVARAHVYAVDNSSTLFEFAALDRPVVVLNSPRYRRGIRFGLRFWQEASVGINVDKPADLADALLRAFEDPLELRESRRAAVARVYPVRDGSSARLAADAVVGLVRKACAVCGAPHASCGGPTVHIPIDVPRESEPRVGTLKRYPNPDRPGAFIKLDEAGARRMGLLGQELAKPTRPGLVRSGALSRPAGSVAPAVVDAAPPAPEPQETPKRARSKPVGALEPGGVTHRARAKKAASGSEPSDEGAKTGTDDEEVEAEAPEEEPKDKARPAPSRRRRKVAPAE